ncbi:MAG: pyridoxamine 5'-phosphate oxidase family protein [Candidatus Tectomicrobia bacterium]|nr:pyridoxamine 5'-phosphate oxidase family protein [Candidatus Tectomicrobia bacterium]
MMATWGAFAKADADLANFGAKRFEAGIAYLATVREDGSPRVHPVTPIIGQGHLFVFMEPTSPKGHDLRRDGRYALHSLVSESSVQEGEFVVSGRAVLVDNPASRAMATEAANYTPDDRYILFEFSVEQALSTIYEQGKPIRKRWKEKKG